MKLISSAEVLACAKPSDIVDSLLEMYSSGCRSLERLILTENTKNGISSDSLVQTAWIEGQHFGIKIANIFPENESIGLPTIMGGYLLFDGNTGQPMAYIDGEAETLVKTSCNSAVASKLLSKESSHVMLMIGAGNLAPHLIEAHMAVRPIEKVYIWNRTAHKAEALSETLRNKGVDARAVNEAALAAREADIISCATFADSPVIKGEWLNPGAHVDLVGSYRPDLRESDDDVFRHANCVVVDARFSTVEISGDIVVPLRKGLLSEADIADLFELAQGKRTGRMSDTDITVFKSGGGGHEDLAAAQRIYRLTEDLA